MDLLLTEDEIAILTDYSKPRAQCRQLSEMGIKFEVGRTGKPKVIREVAIKKLGENIKPKEPSVNFAALNNL